ncbi:NAD(P)-binding protein [Undibacterium sp.]|jgi:hypothetical protein|uniref:NAD(P)-binding protein n=1 Tax=Undibacterium sp. TaxID=1914977 RepID=UPI002CD857C6|nr:NAD(P)-binding protein [Undibacterium sp.]HTD02744.1 NAD(P)-binding protein [Undibacterium sp.]
MMKKTTVQAPDILHKNFLSISDFLASSKLYDNVFLLGSLQSGVTLYKQQVRSHNLIWALSEAELLTETSRVAVIGGGASGLTAAAAILVKNSTATVTIFERHSDFCPLQLGCDIRWIHPKIYSWPSAGSREGSAGLPILNWREGRASDVASYILKGFAQIAQKHDLSSERLKAFLEVEHIRFNPTTMKIDWIGKETAFKSDFFQKRRSIGCSDQFDLVILATGFGREIAPANFVNRLYWQNDFLAQPELSNEKKVYLVSGTGDGALVDVFRLTIERFRQERILKELFASDIDIFEAKFAQKITSSQAKGQSWLKLFDELIVESEPLKLACDELGRRIRSDTKVLLHISGKHGNVREFHQVLDAKSSVINKIIIFLLLRNGAFIPVCGDMETVIRSYSVDIENVICRHRTRQI